MREPFPLPLLPLESGAEMPMHRQLYEAMRQAILQGTLRADTRLPSTRELARELGVSRNTVMNAFELLIAEGYLEGRHGSGTFVCRVLADDILNFRGLVVSTHAKAQRANAGVSKRGAELSQNWFWNPAKIQPFQSGTPALEEFPFEIWGRLWKRRWRSRPKNLLAQSDRIGFEPLRAAIAQYVNKTRAVNCEPEQVILVSGARRGLNLAARVLADPGDAAWVEEPGYRGSRAILQNAGLRLVPVPVDEEGLVVEAGLKRKPSAKLALVTPSHQYPLGITLSLTRRLALLQWAKRTGSWIVEDDYDCEYHYYGRPIPSLQGLDRGESVLYLGSFNKVLFPTLRLGYVIVPPALVRQFVACHAVLDGPSRLVEQAVLADFITEGHFARHVRRMRTVYAERQTTLIDAAARHLAGLLEIEPSEAGMHLVGWLPEGVDDRAVVQRAAEHNITVEPLSICYYSTPHRSGLLLGYTGTAPQQLRDATGKLATVLSACL